MVQKMKKSTSMLDDYRMESSDSEATDEATDEDPFADTVLPA